MSTIAAPSAFPAKATPFSDACRVAPKWIGVWLLGIAALVVLTVMVGGATRLTDSGLSITEWAPIKGILPPLNNADWARAFADYRQTTEFQQQNVRISDDQFRFIFLMEWGHRNLGRLIGLLVFGPLVGITLAGRLKAPLLWRLWGVCALVGVQGVIGWMMVKSGLVGRLDVHPGWLATHLGTATLLLGACWVIALHILVPQHTERRTPLHPVLFAMPALAWLQIVLGGLVAGNDAGHAYGDWPTLGGHWFPPEYFSQVPLLRNLFENAAAVQFNHRLFGYILVLTGFVVAYIVRDYRARPRLLGFSLAGLGVIQIVLGVLTLWTGVDIHVALTHQFIAMVIWVCALSVSYHARVRYDNTVSQDIENKAK